MKSAERLGLVGIGGVAQSFIARLPSLHTRLGPIKGASFPAARRLVLALRAGFAVPHYSALEFCPAIWVVAPEASVERVMRDLAAQTPMKKTCIVICNTSRESTSFEYVRAQGARIATLNAVDDSWQTTFLAEGHRDALNHIRRILDKDKRRCTELGPGAKAAYLAAVQMLTDLLRPWTAAAIECMSVAGISKSEADTIAEGLAGRALRAHSRSGIKLWSPPALKELHAGLERAELLRSRCPREAHLYAAGIRLALEYFERDRAPRGSTKHATTSHIQ